MRIVIIGSGNVATVLGRLIKKQGHELLQVVSRNSVHAEALGKELNCSFGAIEEIDAGAELYLVAVSDGALYELSSKIKLDKKLIVHTAGSVSKELLKDISCNYGVCYPLQSLRKEMAYDSNIPFLVDGSTDEVKTLIEDFAKTLSSNVAIASDEERLKLHVAAVVVSNFTNHLYSLAEEFCEKENVDFKLLLPLIKETSERIGHISPATAQTGPAIRNDVFTLGKHVGLLSNHPRLKNIYLKLTDSIMKR